jgi:hypothetical protein
VRKSTESILIERYSQAFKAGGDYFEQRNDKNVRLKSLPIIKGNGGSEL